ncbi:MATE family efflux transporter [uncultured Ilyobacter sp.]|uniref:MATE family efflux transporter n=1 Tax=uncultured Ilyobacter sp. TaxID=544433 RepID=UPI0029F53A71|nr:MATE family efflux transporter [uncultured Ilyobacter sp.]
MKSKIDMTQGSISKGLMKMAFPVMATSFLQMAYNLTDMFWIGRTGSRSVAAVGSAGFYVWFSFAFILVSKIGAEVRVSQSIGGKNFTRAKDYARNALQMNFMLSIFYGTLVYFFSDKLIGFFNLGDQGVISMAVSYLKIIVLGMVFSFSNPVFTGIFNGYGDSRTPFYINTIGIGVNLVLDPLLIFGIGPIPAMGVEGAAIATVLAHLAVFTSFLVYINRDNGVVKSLDLHHKPELYIMKEYITLGLPVALHNGLFTFFTMVIARIIAQWGPLPMAVQKVGSQIEAISWMTASGFQVAVSTFVGQNYGAKQPKRIKKGYATGIAIISVVGVFATLLLIFFARPIFSIFIPEGEVIKFGVEYLKILGYSQLFMCIEIVTAGAFNGLGKTSPPSIVSIAFNALRIPMSIFLSSESLLGLNGVWWTLTITSILKGLVLVGWFLLMVKKTEFFQEDRCLEYNTAAEEKEL